MAPWNQQSSMGPPSPGAPHTRTLAFPAPFFFSFFFSFLSSLSLAPTLFLSLTTIPCDLRQRAPRRHVSASRPRDVLHAQRSRPATNPRRVPSQQATLRRRVTAGGHFQYGVYAYVWDAQGSPTTLLSVPTPAAAHRARFVRRHVVRAGARSLVDTRGPIRGNVHCAPSERELRLDSFFCL